MPHVEHSGLSLHVQVMGEGPPLAMLHGLLVGSMASWYFGAAPRLARRFRVLLSDLRGHGLSSPATGFDLASLVGDLEATLPLAGAGSATLVGHSYGALVALRFALQRRHQVRRLVLVDAPLPPSQVPELTQFMARDPAEMLASLPKMMQDGIAGGSRAGRRLLAQLQRLVRESSLLADLAAEPDFSDDDLRALDVPVVLVYGDRSGCLPAGERLARTLPRARLRVLPGGHFLPAEQPGLLADLLEEELFHG
jgi:pimeloyl-ACP methyl ester carboxylesterase